MSDINPRPLREGDVYPSHVLRDQFGMNAENRQYFTINENEVPNNLHAVIPIAERWAISCDVTRGKEEWEHKQRRIAALAEAEQAFKSKDYSRVVNLMTPFAKELDRIQSAKLALAVKRQ